MKKYINKNNDIWNFMHLTKDDKEKLKNDILNIDNNIKKKPNKNNNSDNNIYIPIIKFWENFWSGNNKNISQINNDSDGINFIYFKDLYMGIITLEKKELKNKKEFKTLEKNEKRITAIKEKSRFIDNDFKYFNENIDQLKKNLDIRYRENYIDPKMSPYIIECTKIRKEMLKYNCNLRIQEGFMINKTLSDLRDDIKKITFQNIKLKEQNYLPIMYYKPNLSYIKNNNILIDNYKEFRNIKNFENNKDIKYGKLIDIIYKEFEINPKELKFIVFTVINLTNKQKINNPPNPPFININDLKILINIYDRYISLNNDLNIESNIKKLNEDLENKLKNYDFYKNIPNHISTENNIIDKAKKYINYIEPNNSATLIGSLYSTDFIKNPFNNFYINSLYSENIKKKIKELYGEYSDTFKIINEAIDKTQNIILNIDNVNKTLDKLNNNDDNNYDLIYNNNNKSKYKIILNKY
jgi:hypothetical protein